MLARNVLVLTVGAIAGCTVPVAGGTTPAEPGAPVQGAQAAQHVDENLARLQALDVFHVGQLVVDYPAGAYSCYGPCPGAAAVIADAKAKAAVRLDELAGVAEKASASASVAPAACEQAAVDANLAALAALHVVGVEGLVVSQPASNPQCYNLPCPADKAAAEQANCARAGKLAAIVAGARGL